LKFSANDLDLTQAPFSLRGSRIMVLEGPSVEGSADAQKALFIAYTLDTTNGKGYRSNLIRIDPTLDGAPLLYTYTADPGRLTLTAREGTVELVFDGAETVRVRTTGGVGVRFYMTYQYHEQFIDRLDGSVIAGFHFVGEFLFECTRGRQTHNGRWNARRMIPEPNFVLWEPDGAGTLEGYLTRADYSPDKKSFTTPFEACAQANQADFDAFCKKYAELSGRYSALGRFAVYLVWICCLQPKGVTSVPMVYMMRNGVLMRAMAWHQGYHAMAAWRDLDLAVDWLYSMFHLRDDYGQLPDGATEGLKVMLATKPPFQGFALSYILDRVGVDALTREHCEKLYKPMTDWMGWWRDRHDLGDGFVSYIHGDESGWDDSTMFRKGLPVASADIMAFLILLAEICGKLAGRLGMTKEQEYWSAESQKMLDAMIKAFWNGERFVARLTKTGETIEYDSIAAYQPIILGKRLPRKIIDKIAETVGDPKKFFTSRCFVSESLESPFYDVNGPFMMGMIIAPVQLMMIVGLYNAGKKELALEAARRWADMCLQLGPTTVTRDVDNEKSKVVPKVLAEGETPVFPQGLPVPGGMSSWGAAVFLVLAELAEYGKGGEA
jgi:hypothetical protein